MKLLELFDKVMPYSLSAGATSTAFKTPKGRTIQVDFESMEGTDIDFKFPNLMELSFFDRRDRFSITYKLSGKGEQYAILSTVIAIGFDFLSLHPDSSLTFSAREPGRIKLYNALIKKYASGEYNFTSERDGLDTRFYIEHT